MQSLYVMYFRERSLRLHLRMALYQICQVLLPKEKEARCIFEYIYFARPDSHIDGISVYACQNQGRTVSLHMDSPVDADLVVGVPESGNAAALGYSLQSGIPYGTAFVKNSYVGQNLHQAEAEQP